MVNDTVLIETTRLSNSRSLRMSLPRRVADRIEAAEGDIIGYYESDTGEIIIRKMN